ASTIRHLVAVGARPFPDRLQLATVTNPRTVGTTPTRRADTLSNGDVGSEDTTQRFGVLSRQVDGVGDTIKTKLDSLVRVPTIEVVNHPDNDFSRHVVVLLVSALQQGDSTSHVVSASDNPRGMR